MTTYILETKNQIFEALNNPKYKWRTIRGIADETGLPFETIYNYIYKYRKEIVESEVPTSDGQPLFTTPENWYKQATWLEKLRAIIVNKTG